MTDDDHTSGSIAARILRTARLEPDLQTKDETEAEERRHRAQAFGYLRGIRDPSTSVEFRFRDGNSMWFPYSLAWALAVQPFRRLLLKFSGDVVYLVLIRGSNLDKPLNDGAINLTHAGLQRHRVLWIREMTEEEIEQVGETGPTIDSIEIGEFESAALKEWLSKKAPAFMS